MEIEILQKNDNKLLNRKEITAKARFEGATPKNADVQNVLAAQLGVATELVVLERNKNIYGAHESELTAKVYNDKASLDKYALKPKAAKKPTDDQAAPAPAAKQEGK